MIDPAAATPAAAYRPGPSAYDLIVIGGGINGAAIAREAALAGHRTLLLERSDLGCGTSAASTRLIHGGLRYLEHAEIGLVRESLAERERLLAAAPHLVAPLKLILPIYRRARRKPWQIRSGMWLYELLSYDKSVPGHAILSRAELLDAVPSLAPEDLLSGASYYDAQVEYPERLVLELARDAADHGAVVETHAPVTRVLVEHGRAVGVEWRRRGEPMQAQASAVVNASGPWLDSLLGGIADAPLIGGTRGSHLIAAPFPGAPAEAVYSEAASDGRPFFVIPWNGLYLIGTTDRHDDADPGEARIDAQELDYLIAETTRLFPAASSLAAHLRYTYAGVRPLPPSSADKPGAITRRHLIRSHKAARGLYSVVGGKLTTHRALAEDVMRKLGRELRPRGRRPTRGRPLPGWLDGEDRGAMSSALGAELGARQADRLWRIYGGVAAELAAATRSAPELAATLAPGSPVLVAELERAFEQDWAETLGDFLLRRCMAGLDADCGLGAAAGAAEWMTRLGRWDAERADAELAAYRDELSRFAVPGAAARLPGYG